MAKELKLRRKIKATREEIYRALTNPFAIALWSGEPAVMNTEAGSEFSLLDEGIVGKNISFIPNEEIKQIWYFGEDVESEVIIRLFPEKEDTLVWVHHQGIPDDAYDNMLEGWNDGYLDPLQAFFEM